MENKKHCCFFFKSKMNAWMNVWIKKWSSYFLIVLFVVFFVDIITKKKENLSKQKYPTVIRLFFRLFVCLFFWNETSFFKPRNSNIFFLKNYYHHFRKKNPINKYQKQRQQQWKWLNCKYYPIDNRWWDSFLFLFFLLLLLLNKNRSKLNFIFIFLVKYWWFVWSHT